MKLTCPHCQVKTNAKKIPVSIPQGIHIQRQCPACQSWFQLKPAQNKLKIVGTLLLLATSLSNFMIDDINLRIGLSGLGFVGILVAFAVTFFGQQEKISPPQ